MKKNGVLAGVFLMFTLSGCVILSPGLPSELIGSWTYSNSYYTQTYTFEARKMYYEDYASNTGGSSSWEDEIIDVNTDEEYFVTKYDCWSWHVSGSTLYLKKEAYSETPASDLPDLWWSDTSVSKDTLSKN